MKLSRSLLIVAPNRPELVEAAAASGADVVVLDLAAVPEAYREAGRTALAPAIAALKAAGKRVHVRVGWIASGLARDDLAVAVMKEVDGLELPAVRLPQDIRDLDVLIREQETAKKLKPGEIVLVAFVASARALLRCAEIPSASTRLAAIALDGGAYCAGLGVPQSRAALEYARRYVVTCAAAYRMQSFDACEGEDDRDADARYARSIGFTGKYVSDAGQSNAINEAFSPVE
jgi:citrate lyase subunit beta/citryl-CoA lyase